MKTGQLLRISGGKPAVQVKRAGGNEIIFTLKEKRATEEECTPLRLITLFKYQGQVVGFKVSRLQEILACWRERPEEPEEEFHGTHLFYLARAWLNERSHALDEKERLDTKEYSAEMSLIAEAEQASREYVLLIPRRIASGILATSPHNIPRVVNA